MSIAVGDLIRDFNQELDDGKYRNQKHCDFANKVRHTCKFLAHTASPFVNPPANQRHQFYGADNREEPPIAYATERLRADAHVRRRAISRRGRRVFASGCRGHGARWNNPQEAQGIKHSTTSYKPRWPASVFFVSACAIWAGLVEEPLADILPDRMRAVEPRRIGLLNFLDPRTALALNS
jgi:hypothetical protein